MGVNAITNAAVYESNSTTKGKEKQDKQPAAVKQEKTGSETAAVYEKTDQPVVKNQVYQRDNATIERLKKEAEQRTQSLRKLVEEMLLKQGETYDSATDIYALLREGKVKVDPETRAQAQKDISEDGYWGINQTADRLVSFAKALTGGDPAKADKMIEAVKKGFEAAEKVWGGELPGICKDTFDSAIEKLEQWRDSEFGDNSMEQSAKEAFSNQASATGMAK
ncbi:MAG: hypothetical protein K0S76_1121 [Herbinix sp.]|nr:hypothetical protein [Herbinix sp.]